MLKTVRKLVRQKRRLARRRKAAGKIVALTSCGIPQAEAIGQAVAETLSETLEPDERELIEAIERRRAELLASNRLIEVRDYGAGGPSDTRSRAEMDGGVTVPSSLAKVCAASKERFWALLLHKLVRKLRPRTGVELGTCVGISAAYQAAAQRFNGGGRFVSLEGCPASAEIAQETWRVLGLDQVSVVVGPFHQTYLKTLEQHAPVDYLFVDGHHDRDATIAYFEQASPYLADPAVLVFDDIAWNEGMKEAWRRITDAPGSVFALDLGPVGIVVRATPGGPTRKFELPL